LAAAPSRTDGIGAASWRSVYAVVYGAFAVTDARTPLLIWFLVYGLYFGLTEGVEKAIVADLAPPHVRGTAFGVYNAVVGIGAFVASVAFGFVWVAYGAPTAFALGGTLAIVATALLFAAVPRAVPAEAV
jgi:hypothetical protein